MELTIDIESILSVKEVSVVQQLDASALKSLLLQLLKQQAQTGEQLKAQQSAIEGLKSRLSQDGKHIDERTVDTSSAATAADLQPTVGLVAPLLDGAGLDTLQKHVDQLERRLTQLEQQQAVNVSSPATVIASASSVPAVPASTANPVAISEVPHTSAAAGTSSSADDGIINNLALSQIQQQKLSESVKELQASLTAAPSSCQNDLHAALASKADTAALDLVQQSLDTKALQSELDQLKSSLANKASRSELDVLLQGLAGQTATPGRAGDAGRHDIDEDGAADKKAQDRLQAMQLQLALQLERIAAKADASALDDANVRVVDAQQKITALTLVVAQLSQRLNEAKQLLVAGQDLHYLGQQGTTAEVIPVGVKPVSPISSDDSKAGQQQVQDILVRLAAVEQILLNSTTPTSASQTTATHSSASAALTRGTESDITVEPSSAMQVPSPVLPRSESGIATRHCNTSDVEQALQQLSADVALIQLQVRQLDQSMQVIDSSTPICATEKGKAAADARPSSAKLWIDGGATSCHEHKQSRQPSAATAARAEQQSMVGTVSLSERTSDSAVTGTPGANLSGVTSSGIKESSHGSLKQAAAPDAADVLLEDHVQAGIHQDPATTALLEDLSSRLTGLQQQVERLEVTKADRGDVQRLQAVTTAVQAAAGDSHKQNALPAVTQQATSNVTPAADITTAHSQAAYIAAVPIAVHKPDRSLLTVQHPAATTKISRQAAEHQPASDQISHETHQQSRGPTTGSMMSTSQLDQLSAAVEQLAQAVCLTSTGQAAAAPEPVPAGGVAASGQSTPRHFAVAGGSRSPLTQYASDTRSRDVGGIFAPLGPHMAELGRLLQAGKVSRKLDWFDPTLLQKLAQRLAAAEAILKSMHADHPATVGAGGGSPTDVEAKLKKLAADVRTLKERSGIAKQGMMQVGVRPGDGDHAMLSSKPLMGYRCMACDRPLGSLEQSPGPYLPTGLMPHSLNTDAVLGAGRLPPATQVGGPTGSVAHDDSAPSAHAAMTEGTAGSGKRVAGPQNWYASHGPPAEQLPKADVGPHLPPGGWRGALPRGDDGTVLPMLVARGGSPVSSR